ncbi:acetyltransferase [Microbacteriaceae bacterium VKM Ac-2855]|nr:acetyltransferase [Microbacteriaceae bacterium VKM Ac-2855]
MTRTTTGRLVTGAPGDVVYHRSVQGFGDIRITVLDPDGDLDLIHGWVTQERARFWGLGDLSRDELRQTYAFVDSLPSHHAFVLRRDGEPIALVQTYEPENDPVGAYYPVEPGDVGVHFFLGGRGAPIAGLTTRVVAVLAEFVFAEPDAHRVVVEPDTGNEAAVARMRRVGFELGPVIELPTKRAQLAFLTRKTAGRLREGLSPRPTPVTLEP